jgi:hypothetical protein
MSISMSIWKNLVIAASLLSWLPGAQAQSTAVEEEHVLSVMRSVAGAWNEGRTPPSSYFESSLTVVDNTPPYVFQGPDAVEDWIKAYRESQPKGTEGAKTSLHLQQPKALAINSGHAYVAIPAEWTVRLNGQSDVSYGMITATLNRRDQDWRIGTWTWTPRDR